MGRLARAAPVDPLAVAELGAPTPCRSQARRRASSPLRERRSFPLRLRHVAGAARCPTGPASARPARSVHAPRPGRLRPSSPNRRAALPGRHRPAPPRVPTREHRQIEQVVAHVGDARIGDVCVADDLLVGLELALDALFDDPDGELGGAMGGRARRAGRADRPPARTLGPDDSCAVPDVKALRFGAVGVHHDRTVRQHAIDIRTAIEFATPSPRATFGDSISDRGKGQGQPTLDGFFRTSGAARGRGGESPLPPSRGRRRR